MTRRSKTADSALYPLEPPRSDPHFAAARALTERLIKAGFEAYFAGGWVRDRLLGRHHGDIDIATSAPPEAITRLATRSVCVGAQFGCIIAIEGPERFEVATFRKEGPYIDGRHPSTWQIGTALEDANRRDFTVNGLFYDAQRERVIDFVDGVSDLRRRRLCCIGDPKSRFTEDKLRVVRCARLAAQLDFQIERQTALAAKAFSSQVSRAVSRERIWEELAKIASGPDPERGFGLLHQLHLLALIVEGEFSGSAPEAIATFSRWPKATAPIYYLLALMVQPGSPPTPLSGSGHLSGELAARFPLTRTDRRRLNHWQRLLELASGDFPPTRRSQWCALWAESIADEAFGALFAIAEGDFEQIHTDFKRSLDPHVLRRKEGAPLVTSRHLRERGVASGTTMGRLLTKAVAIAEERDLSTAEEVLAALLIDAQPLK